MMRRRGTPFVARMNQRMSSIGATRFTARLRSSSPASTSSSGPTGAITPALLMSTALS